MKRAGRCVIRKPQQRFTRLVEVFRGNSKWLARVGESETCKRITRISKRDEMHHWFMTHFNGRFVTFD